MTLQLEKEFPALNSVTQRLLHSRSRTLHWLSSLSRFLSGLVFGPFHFCFLYCLWMKWSVAALKFEEGIYRAKTAARRSEQFVNIFTSVPNISTIPSDNQLLVRLSAAFCVDPAGLIILYLPTHRSHYSIIIPAPTAFHVTCFCGQRPV